MRFYSNGKMIQIPSGGGGSNPIGTIVSFMGTKPPFGYLVCDGSIYNITQYPDLANFFEDQFGTKNNFGGDGTTTFAVPDLRNMFLMGYHGEAEEHLSGNIGTKQEGTEFPFILSGGTSRQNSMIAWMLPNTPGNDGAQLSPINRDKSIMHSNHVYACIADGSQSPSDWTNNSLFGDEGAGDAYTARPVNVAVLYCIKATPGGTGDSGGVTMDEVNAAIDAAITGAMEEAY